MKKGECSESWLSHYVLVDKNKFLTDLNALRPLDSNAKLCLIVHTQTEKNLKERWLSYLC